MCNCTTKICVPDLCEGWDETRHLAWYRATTQNWKESKEIMDTYLKHGERLLILCGFWPHDEEINQLILAYYRRVISQSCPIPDYDEVGDFDDIEDRW
jgi:hypothetical protein